MTSEPLTDAHFFTVDVEEYFQVHAFQDHIAPEDWSTLPSRVEHGVDVILEILAAHDTEATFFVLGWIAANHPHLVRKISEAGHEVASHGWSHRRLTELDPPAVREELRSSKERLEELAGTDVIGFRAPGFSLTPGREWVFDLLLEEGYVYDSSLFPIRRPAYGYPGVLTVPHLISRQAGTLLELPLSTLRWQGLRLPAAGGGYFRQMPYEVTRRALRQCAERGVPGVFYVHPWEVDPEQPRLSVPLLSRVRHYGGIGKVRARLERLLEEFRFTSVARRLGMQNGELVGDPLANVLSG